MKEKETGQSINEQSSVVEDLTLNETNAANIKGGPSDYLLELDGIKGESRTLPEVTTYTYDLKMSKK